MTSDSGDLRTFLAESPPAPEPFLHRPSLGIRTRLALGFLSLFVVAIAVTVAAYVMLSRLEVRLRFLEGADRYTVEIQQARRFEKNYFLYGTNLQDVQEHLANARSLLTSTESDAIQILPASSIRRMREHLDRYELLIDRLTRLGTGTAGSEERSAIEAQLRTHGSQAIAFAFELAQQERLSVDRTLSLFKKLPFFFLAALLVLSVLIANFLGRQMVGPLTRLVSAAGRIAQGDFTPMQPARWYRDEFSNLASALNTMVAELARRQNVLVQSHKLRAVGTLTAGVAHELNNPINNIMLTAEMLKEDYQDLSDAARLDMVNDLVEQAGRSQKIVRNLLDFARERKIQPERLDLVELLRTSASLTVSQIKLTGARIAMKIPDNLPPVHGDGQSLSQVFLNLLLNASEHGAGKGGSITVSAEEAQEGDFVLVRVSDDGPGIPPHVLPYIFDPFFTTKSKGRGTGLGLSVSLGIMRQHGGDIRVESVPGEGATFTVLLPTVKIPNVGGKR
jgi:two-component system NtrC family sensor kinase